VNKTVLKMQKLVQRDIQEQLNPKSQTVQDNYRQVVCICLWTLLAKYHKHLLDSPHKR